LLRAIAGRLGAMLRPADTAAKIAGDQFALLLDGVVTERQANVVAQRVERAIDRPFMVDGHELSITAGIGLAISDARVLAADLIGMIGALGLHVLRTSLERLAAWRRQGIVSEGFRISVNISARQLGDPRLPAMLRAALAGAGLPADSLRLDITESAVLREPD